MGLNCPDPAFPALLPLLSSSSSKAAQPRAAQRGGMKFSQVSGCPSTQQHLAIEKSHQCDCLL